MAEYGLVESFDIDNGELDGATPAECFVLGYEFAQVCAEAAGVHKFRRMIHDRNRDRVKKALDARGRRHTIGPSVAGWISLIVFERSD